MAAAVTVASCGAAGTGRPAPAARTASEGSLAVVRSACETDGARALLPGSDGLDTSAVPDDTPAVCGCWVSWMQQHLSPPERDAVVTGITLSASVMSVTSVELLDRLSAALRSCEPRPALNGSTTALPSPPVSSPGP